MISDDVTKIELEARKRALEEYKLRCQSLRSENDALKAEKDQREMDALQIISFLRRDAERKDELIESLKGTITQQRDVFSQQREEEAETNNSKFGDLETRLEGEASAQRSHVEAIERELVELQEFKEQKTVLEETMQRLEQVNIAGSMHVLRWAA